MSDKDSLVTTSTGRHDKELSAHSQGIDTSARARAGSTAESVPDDRPNVTDLSSSPSPAHPTSPSRTPVIVSGSTSTVVPPQHAAFHRPLYPGPHSHAQCGPPPQHYGPPTPHPTHLNGLGHHHHPPPLPGPYAVHQQIPVLVDRCPRCAFVPTVPADLPPPPLPPLGSYVAPSLYPPPQCPQQIPPPSTAPRPPLLAPAPAPATPPSSSGQQPSPSALPQQPPPQPPQSTAVCRPYAPIQVAPEFRCPRYFPNSGRPPAPTHVPNLLQNQHLPDATLGMPDESRYLPYDEDGYVDEPFIPLPRYAPVPTPEAIAATAPKWPKPKKSKDPAIYNPEGLSRREKAKRVGPTRLTRDQRRDVLLMRRLGYAFEHIARFLGVTVSACHYTSRKGTAEVEHQYAGRRVNIAPDIVTRMVEYVKDYQKKQRLAGIDKKTGKLKIPMLTYHLIRDNIFRNENGEVPAELKYTDDALKQVLNKYGLWLRKPMTQSRKELGRTFGLQQWQDKLARDRAEAQKKAAEAATAGQPVNGEPAAIASGAMVVERPGSDVEYVDMENENENEDEKMDEEDGVSDRAPSDEDDRDDDDEDEQTVQNMHIEDQLRHAMTTSECSC